MILTVQVVYEYMGRLLTVLITLDSIIENQAALRDHWKLYRRSDRSLSSLSSVFIFCFCHFSCLFLWLFFPHDGVAEYDTTCCNSSVHLFNCLLCCSSFLVELHTVTEVALIWSLTYKKSTVFYITNMLLCLRNSRTTTPV